MRQLHCLFARASEPLSLHLCKGSGTVDAQLLGTLFGRQQQWQGPCIIILDASAAIQTIGNDSVQGGGLKVFAPRTVSGRISADAACFLSDGSALVAVQNYKIRQATGEETFKQTVTVLSPAHVVAVEFADAAPLEDLGLPVPPPKPTSGSNPGTQQRPKTK